MKKLLSVASFFILCIVITGCLKDRVFPLPAAITGPGGKNNIQPGTLVVNEFLARGSTFTNELVTDPATGSDWVEIYNTTNDTILLESGKWFVTDSLPDSQKFRLPQTTIYPKGFLVIWCDNFDTTITQIHSNFSLSKDGEQIGLFYVKDGTTSFFVDSYTFGPQQSAVSFGRNPDGSSNWESFNTPTPGSSNH